VWVERHDPDAVRRVRNTVRGRGVSVQHNDDKSGVTTIVMRLTKPGAALFMGRVRKMAKGVCPHDPRTLDQRMADAAEALAADADHLQCLCGAATCPAAADDGAASRFVVHIYAEAEAVEAELDPLIHGEGVFTKPDGVTVTYPKKTKTKTTTNAQPMDTGQEPDGSRGSSPRQSRAHTSPEGSESPEAVFESAGGTEGSSDEQGAPGGSEPEVVDTDADEDCESTNEEPVAPASDTSHSAETHSAPAAPTNSPRQCGRPPGYLPGFGVVPSALIAALLAAGATVRRIQTPGIEPADGYRIPTAQREFAQARDLCCRVPGCDRPIYEADLDHTIAWGDGGPTHVSNIKGYCRWHHLIKTFRAGWSDIQNPDGTVIVNTPTGHTYTSIPFSRILFPTSSTASPPVQRGSPRKEVAADKSAKMPKRKRTKAQDRAYRIAAERALNAAYRNYHTDPAERTIADIWGYLRDPADVTDSDDPPPF
jgi:hypothetical protein